MTNPNKNEKSPQNESHAATVEFSIQPLPSGLVACKFSCGEPARHLITGRFADGVEYHMHVCGRQHMGGEFWAYLIATTVNAPVLVDPADGCPNCNSEDVYKMEHVTHEDWYECDNCGSSFRTLPQEPPLSNTAEKDHFHNGIDTAAALVAAVWLDKEPQQ